MSTETLSGTRNVLRFESVDKYHTDIDDRKVQAQYQGERFGLRLPESMYNALGGPDTITVTVEPGDLLNEYPE